MRKFVKFAKLAGIVEWNALPPRILPCHEYRVLMGSQDQGRASHACTYKAFIFVKSPSHAGISPLSWLL